MVTENATKVLKLPTLKLTCSRIVGITSDIHGWLMVEMEDVHDDSLTDNADVILEVLQPIIEQRIEDAIKAREDAIYEARIRAYAENCR
jgi:hypothetical protein